MIIPVLKFSYRSLLYFFEILGAIGFAGLVVMCVLFWKLSNGPVDVTYAADIVKEALVTDDQRANLTFDKIVAEWPEFSGAISIGMSGVKLYENNKPVLSIPQLGLRIAKAPLLIGKVKPEVVIAKDATIKFVRAKNGGLHLLLNDKNGTPIVEDKKTPEKEFDIQSLGEAFFKGGNLPDYQQIKPLAEMEKFKVEDAHFIIVDEETKKLINLSHVNFDLVRAPHDFTIKAHYNEGTNAESHFNVSLSRDPKEKNIKFSALVDNVNLTALLPLFYPIKLNETVQFIAASHVDGVLDKNWNLERLEGNISTEKGELSLGSLYNGKLTLSDLNGDFLYDNNDKYVLLQNGRIKINGRPFQLNGEKSTKDSKDFIFPLYLKADEISFDDIRDIWPEDMRHSVAADWLTHRLSKAKVKNLKLRLPLNFANIADLKTNDIIASLDYEGLTADYRPPLYPVTNAKGKATLKGDVLTIMVGSGKMMDMDVQKATITIPHLTHPSEVGMVDIDADIQGDLSSPLRYIALEPIFLGEKIGINPDKVKGKTNFHVDVNFPALAELPKEQVTVAVQAEIRDMLLPSIVKGMDLTGGPYKLTVDAGAVTLAGKGQLGGRDIDLEYKEYIDRSVTDFPTEIKASLLADKKLRDAFGVKIDQFITGSAPTSIVYKQGKKGEELIAIQSDLTPATVMFSPFKYKKREGVGGSMSCDVVLQDGHVKKINNLDISVAKNGQTKGNLVFGPFGKKYDVKSGRFSSITLAGDNNFSLEFAQTSPNIFDARITGKRLDGRPFLGGKKDIVSTTKNSDATQVSLTADVLEIRTGDDSGQILKSPTLALKTDKNGDVKFLDLKGQLKTGNLSVLLQPDATGQTTLRIASDNAGEALRTLGMYDRMIGGTMDIRGKQIKGKGINDIGGKAVIRDFTVVRAPILAKLINLFSLSGLTELLQNKGIAFSSLQTDFEWKETSSGRLIALQDGRTKGASIGLTFGGTLNQDKQSIDLKGTFVPMSEINGFFNKIPLIGGLLTGGKDGGVIATTYTMTGKSSDPTVMLNPLSALTPGFIRTILFEDNKNIFEDNEKVETKKNGDQGKTYNR